MIAEREIAGFVLPFTIGIIASTALTGAFFTISITPAALSAILVSVPIFLLIHPSHHKWNRYVLIFLLLTASAGCGLFTGLTQSLCSLSAAHDSQSVSDVLTGLSESLKFRIDQIRFQDTATNSIITALITGERAGIPPETVSAFRESGASHILALSGLHLGIIYGIISRLLSFMGHSPRANRIRAFLIIASCGLYTAITGAGASITRAFLFILIGETIRLFNRYRSTAQALMTALFLQLLFSPGSIRDVGFQLSYAAMAGIAFIFPRLKNMWPEGKGGIMKWIWVSAAMSVSCQVTTGPLAYFYFGTFPQHFLLTNLIAMPLTGLIIPSALLTITLDSIGICPDLLISFTETLVGLMSKVLSIIASM